MRITRPPIAGLQYLIMNPESLLNGQITTAAQIAWLWSYDGQDFTYDPDGDTIINKSLGGINASDILGYLDGGIGFVTQFSTPAQYEMTYQVEDSRGAKSSITKFIINVEPTDGHARPTCVVKTSSRELRTNQMLLINYADSKDSNGQAISDVSGIVITEEGVHENIFNYVVEIDGKKQISLTEAYIKFPIEGTYEVRLSTKDSQGAWSNWVSFQVVVSGTGEVILSDVETISNSQTGSVNPIPEGSSSRWVDYDKSTRMADTYDSPEYVYENVTSRMPVNGITGYYLGSDFTISGYAKYSDGTPRANVTVYVTMPIGARQFQLNLTTDANGYFTHHTAYEEYFTLLGYETVSRGNMGESTGTAFFGQLDEMAYITTTEMTISCQNAAAYTKTIMATTGYHTKQLGDGWEYKKRSDGSWFWLDTK